MVRISAFAKISPVAIVHALHWSFVQVLIMASSSETEQSPSSFTIDKLCDHCGAPASWADSSSQNLTWNESLQLHISRYLRSPRMWPFGYILDSPYSPFQVEAEMPERGWRDAFEDLLAVESGHGLIDRESREKEKQLARRLVLEKGIRKVDKINVRLKRNESWAFLTQCLRDEAAKANLTKIVHSIDNESFPHLYSLNKDLIAQAQTIIKTYQALADEDSVFPAGRMRSRTHWLISLITSGAVKGWSSELGNSSDGLHLRLSQVGDDGGQMFTEQEIDRRFREGLQYSLESPSWSVMENGHYPDQAFQLEDYHREKIADGAPPPQPLSLGRSILRQIVHTELGPTRMGQELHKVKLVNHNANGRVENKEIVGDATKVLEEVEEAHRDMEDALHAMDFAEEEWYLKANEAILRQRQEVDEDKDWNRRTP